MMSSIGTIWELDGTIETQGPTSDMLNSNLYFSKTPEGIHEGWETLVYSTLIYK